MFALGVDPEAFAVKQEREALRMERQRQVMTKAAAGLGVPLDALAGLPIIDVMKAVSKAMGDAPVDAMMVKRALAELAATD